MSREISDIGWEPDGTCLITYLDTRDIRCEGAVAVRQTIRVTRSEQYADGIDAIVTATLALVKDALADWSESDPAELDLERADGPRQGRAFEAKVDEPELELDEIGDDDSATAVARRNWQAIEDARRGHGAVLPDDGPAAVGDVEQPPDDQAPQGAVGAADAR